MQTPVHADTLILLILNTELDKIPSLIETIILKLLNLFICHLVCIYFQKESHHSS